jgi:glycine cleavage system regulatory protein
MADVILTLLGTDRPGLVEGVADAVARVGGNWLESRMAHLGGKFAGILRAQVPTDALPQLREALDRMAGDDLTIMFEHDVTTAQGAPQRSLELELVGLDRPGIVRDISRVLVTSRANVEEITTDCSSAPMSGEMLFRARIRAAVPVDTDLARLRAELERFATDLMVELRVIEAVIGGAKVKQEGRG